MHRRLYSLKPLKRNSYYVIYLFVGYYTGIKAIELVKN